MTALSKPRAGLKNLTFSRMVTVTYHLSLSQGRKGIYGCWYLAFSVFCWWHFVPGLAVCILVHKDTFKTDLIWWYLLVFLTFCNQSGQFDSQSKIVHTFCSLKWNSLLVTQRLIHCLPKFHHLVTKHNCNLY